MEKGLGFYCILVNLMLLKQCLRSDQWNGSMFCKPAEENKEHTMTFMCSYHDSLKTAQLVIQRNNQVVSRCTFVTSCHDLHPNDFKTVIVFNASNAHVTINMHIFNVSRSSRNTWMIIKNETIIERCNMIIYTRPRNVTCHKSMTSDGLKVNCWTSQTYPNAKCQSNLKFLKIPSLVFNTWNNFHNELLSSDPTYYKFSCFVAAKREEIQAGQYELNINIYPNISGTEKDFEYGNNDILSINLDYPSVQLKVCPEIVEENAEVTCTCERSDSSLINASFGWFRSNAIDHPIKNEFNVHNGSLILFKASRKTSEYHCKAINALNWTSTKSTAVYSPSIIARAHNISCTKKTSRDLLTVVCQTDKVFPCAQCRFQIKYNFIYYIYTDYAITHDNLKISNDPVYYKTTCTLKIARRNLTHGVYDIDVIISPNITGGDNDMKYGTKTTIHVNPADQVQGVSIVSIGAFIAIIVSATVCFISMCCVVVHKRQQDDKKKNLLNQLSLHHVSNTYKPIADKDDYTEKNKLC